MSVIVLWWIAYKFNISISLEKNANLFCRRKSLLESVSIFATFNVSCTPNRGFKTSNNKITRAWRVSRLAGFFSLLIIMTLFYWLPQEQAAAFEGLAHVLRRCCRWSMEVFRLPGLLLAIVDAIHEKFSNAESSLLGVADRLRVLCTSRNIND